MKRFAIWLDADITVKEAAAIFKSAGYHLHADGFGRWVVDEVPGCLRKDEPETNVVRMPRAKIERKS